MSQASGQAPVVGGRDRALLQDGVGDLAQHRDEAAHELDARHLQGEDRDRAFGALPVVGGGDVEGHLKDKRGLAHRGTCAADDEVSRVEAGGHRVEVGKADLEALHGLPRLQDRVDVHEELLREGRDGLEVLAELLAAHLEDELLRLVDLLLDVGHLGVVDHPDDLAARLFQAAHGGLVEDDLRVARAIGGAWDGRGRAR